MYREVSVTRVSGFTLVELMITLTVAAIGVALAVPSYQEVIRKRQTESLSERFASFVNLAHTEAVKRFGEITVNVAWTTEAEWCVGAVMGPDACDCTGVDAGSLCAIDGVGFILSSESGAWAGMLDPAVEGNGVTFTFAPVRGILADDVESLKNHEFSFQSDNDHFLAEVAVLPTGRVSICSSGGQRLTTFDPCR